MVKISSVTPGSPADKAGIKGGDFLISIDGHDINDVLDYRFYIYEKRLATVCSRGGSMYETVITKNTYAEPGMEFSSYLIDEQKSCSNNCIFCFIDQNPKGMRDTIYFKDDDTRMSFLFGSYVTLTNLTDADIERIIRMRISPVNVSVHTMRPELRRKIMRNRRAGETLEYLYRLAEAGIRINAQLVLCPGINDGEELRFTIEKLCGLMPALQSTAAVPVGLTCYREGLYPLREYTREEAAEVINTVETAAQNCLEKYGERVFYCSDEFYLKAGRPLPGYDYYGDFDQLENGVGLIALFREEFFSKIEECFPEEALDISATIVTGKAAGPFIRELIEEFKDRFAGADIDVKEIENHYYGKSVTVAGLITARDIISQLEGEDLGRKVLIPAVMLRAEGDMFLDGLTPDELSCRIGRPVVPVKNDGAELIKALLDCRAADDRKE